VAKSVSRISAIPCPLVRMLKMALSETQATLGCGHGAFFVFSLSFLTFSSGSDRLEAPPGASRLPSALIEAPRGASRRLEAPRAARDRGTAAGRERPEGSGGPTESGALSCVADQAPPHGAPVRTRPTTDRLARAARAARAGLSGLGRVRTGAPCGDLASHTAARARQGRPARTARGALEAPRSASKGLEGPRGASRRLEAPRGASGRRETSNVLDFTRSVLLI